MCMYYAMTSYGAALEQYQDQESVRLANTLSNLATLYSHQGKFVNALSQYKIILGLQSRVLPRSHRLISQTLKAMGHTCESLQRYGEALGQYNAALEMERKWHQTEIHGDLAETYHCIGHVYTLERDYDNALMYYEKALVIKKLVHGPQHVEIIATLNHMGNLHKYRGQYDMALAIHSEVLILKKQLYGLESPSFQTTAELIGKINRIEVIKQNAEDSIKAYITQRSHQGIGLHINGIGFSKDAKVEGASFLLQLLKDTGVESFNNFNKTVGYYKHKGAIENGRLYKIVEKVRLEAFTNFK